MMANEFIQIVLFFGLLIGLTPCVGRFMARVFQGQKTFLHPLLQPVERLALRAGGVDEKAEMTWMGYFLAALIFNVVGIISLMGLEMTQKWLPLNPQHFDNVPWALALNTAISFITNTNWQAYAGENTMSYLTQMAGLAVHNFLSAATGMAILLAVIRGLTRASARTIGNFWVDLTRSTLYVLLPFSVLLALALCGQGVVQNFRPYATAQLLEPYTTQVPKTDDKGQPVMTNIAVTVRLPQLDAQGHAVLSNGAPVMAAVPQKDAKGNALMTNVPVMVDQQVTSQLIPTGPAASQIAIKHLGTNGGGFYGQNSAHPFENPTPLSDFLEMLGLIIIPAGLVYAFGVMIGDGRHAWCIFGVMLVLLVGEFALAWHAESQPNPLMANVQPLMEGKEQRFGVMNSVLFAVATTGTSCGAVNSMHDSFTPLAGLMPMWNLMLACIVFGGVGAGLYGILMHVLLAVFIAGLMIGRTPEYLGKKIQAWEASWAIVALLAPSAVILFGTALACSLPAGLAGISNQGPHGLSEILYGYASGAANNGSAFGGLNANTNFYNLTLGAAMFLGRFVVALAVLAIAGSFAAKKTVPASPGTLPTNNLTFAFVLFGLILIVAALTFFPALCCGPIVEHWLMHASRTF
ncbi:MAG: potassium-transporting ATPase subunit KdpA [Verrucomicrobiota bacterium]|jgi:K+-transporting ATPase ATPase A chain